MEIIKCEKCFLLEGQHLNPNCCGGINEIWLPINGYEEKYLISSFGRVKTLKRFSHAEFSKRVVEEKIKNQNIDKDGYPQLCLSGGYKKKRFSAHRLVATHFIPNPKNKPQVNHINGIKTDNRVENLEWVTAAENNLHKYRVLKMIHWRTKKKQNENI